MLLLVASNALAQTTWTVRPDGGSVLQCDGKHNAAYTGGITQQWIAANPVGVGYQFVDNNNHLEQVTVLGTTSAHFQPTWSTTGGVVTDGTSVAQDKGVLPSNQACAFNHPFWMLNSSFAWAHMVGGDTIQFVNTSGTSDTYYMGERNAGVGQDWGWYSPFCPQPNQGGGAGASCILPPPPSGTSGAHTKILGQNVGSCHDSGHTHLVNPTILTGINAEFSVLQAWATNYVDIDCIEVTQADKCTSSAISPGACASTSNYVRYGGLVLNYLGNSPSVPGPTNLTLVDFAAVGISGAGILGSKLNPLSGSGVFSATDVYIIGNGSAGWNGDSGGCETSCESIGTMNLSHVIVDWSGCVPAVYPYDMTKADTALGFDYCGDSGTGYGDGFVQIAGAMVLNVDHSFFRWNMQDGFDALHIGDDPSVNSTININTSWSEGNQGATFKMSAGPTSSASNNVSVGNCAVTGTASNFPLNPTGWNSHLTSDQQCRVDHAGDEWSFQLNDNSTVTLTNNTSVGYGHVMYDVECNLTATPSQTNCTANGAKVNFNNNLSKGYVDTVLGELAAGFYLGTGVTTTAFSNGATNNLWNTMYVNTGCPDLAISSPVPTNSQCGDPLLIAESNINAINPNITTSSPAYQHGVTTSGITTDYNGNARPGSNPSIGAFEPESGGATVASIALSPTSASLVQGLTSTPFSCVATMSDFSTEPCPSPVWSSATTSHATINSSSGLITGVSAGTSVISATSSGFTTIPTATITVTAPAVASIAIAPPTCSVAIGATCTLACTATLNNFTTTACTSPAYTSATPSHATVNSSTGVVTGVAAGSTNITATASGFTSNTNVTTVAAASPTINIQVTGTWSNSLLQ